MSEANELLNGLKKVGQGLGAAKGAAITAPAAGAAFYAGIPLAMAVPAAPVVMAGTVLAAGAVGGWYLGAAVVKEVTGWFD